MKLVKSFAFFFLPAAYNKSKSGHRLLLLQLVSSDFDRQARRKYAAACGQEQTGSWEWVRLPFSNAVRTFAPSQAAASVLGNGGASLGFVR